MSRGWIGVDLDGTLAEYGKFQGHGHIGPPVPAMLERVKRWLAEGHEVRIFTARACDVAAIAVVKLWCEEHVGQSLQVTNVKDFDMRVLYDDRAVAVEKNTGELLGGHHHVDRTGPSNLEQHAEAELRAAGLFSDLSPYGGHVAKAVMKLVRAHADVDHSGGSHEMTLILFTRLANFSPLTPLTSDPSEWMVVADPGSSHEPTGLWQSRRQHSCFSRDGGKTWYDIDEPAPPAAS